MLGSKILELVEGFEVVSFDVFDTLLMRNVHCPADVWNLVGRENGMAGFFAARVAADRKSYQNAIARNAETTLDEIYQLMGKKWESCKDIELGYERKSLFANPEVLLLWNEIGKMGKRRVLVSDMYLPQGFIEEVLRENGIEGWDDIFISSKFGCRKSSGKLFEKMISRLGVEAGCVLHIGDNEISDYESPMRLGITAFRYPKLIDRFYGKFKGVESFRNYRQSLERDRIVGALAKGWYCYSFTRSKISFWNRFGYMFGGLWGYAYVDWVGREARRRGYTHLMFVGRDGYIWQKLARQMFPDIQCDYFYAPRTISVRVLGAMGSDSEAVRDRQKYMSENLNGVDPEHERLAYAEYLSQFGIDPKNTAVVDGISSAFSAQRLVEAAIGGRVFTFYQLAYVKPDFGVGFYESIRLLYGVPFQDLSEYIFSSPEMPVSNLKDGKPVPRKEVSPFERVKTSVCDEIADGVMNCATALAEANIRVSPQEVYDYLDFAEQSLTLEDRMELECARNATDVAHRKYVPVLCRQTEKLISRFFVFGRPLLKIRYEMSNGCFVRVALLFGLLPVMVKKTQVLRFAKTVGS